MKSIPVQSTQVLFLRNDSQENLLISIGKYYCICGKKMLYKTFSGSRRSCRKSDQLPQVIPLICSIKLSGCIDCMCTSVSYIWVDYLIVQVFMCMCMFMFTHRDCRVTGKIKASTTFVAILDKWQFKGWISHLFHLRQTCTDTNSERCRFILLHCDRLRNGLYGSTVLFTWLEACKQKRLGGRQHCTHCDVKAGHASTCASFKYLHDLMGQEKCGPCAFESLKPPVRLYFISLSTYISGGNVQGHEKCCGL